MKKRQRKKLEKCALQKVCSVLAGEKSKAPKLNPTGRNDFQVE